MQKPIIGITANQRLNPDFGNTIVSYVPTDFITAVRECGGIPIIIPIADRETIKTYVDLVDKIILTGGQNVDPVYYGEEKTAQVDDFLKIRDESEFALVSEALEQKKPLFSVCRGTQLINVALGGNLNQHIDNHCQEEDSSIPTHDITIDESSILGKIYGTTSSINSFHRQSIKDLSPKLKIIARDPKDNIIEAVESTDKDLRILGIQWHPEFLYQSRRKEKELFNYVVNEL